MSLQGRSKDREPLGHSSAQRAAGRRRYPEITAPAGWRAAPVLVSGGVLSAGSIF
jgi:hypothetical protein